VRVTSKRVRVSTEYAETAWPDRGPPRSEARIAESILMLPSPPIFFPPLSPSPPTPAPRRSAATECELRFDMRAAACQHEGPPGCPTFRVSSQRFRDPRLGRSPSWGGGDTRPPSRKTKFGRKQQKERKGGEKREERREKIRERKKDRTEKNNKNPFVTHHVPPFGMPLESRRLTWNALGAMATAVHPRRYHTLVQNHKRRTDHRFHRARASRRKSPDANGSPDRNVNVIDRIA